MFHGILKDTLSNITPGRVYLPLRYFINSWRGYVENDVSALKYFVSEGDVVVDVGAHKCAYTIPLVRMGAIVHAFEANPDLVVVLEDWAQVHPNVNIYGIGLGDKTGSRPLNIPIDEFGVVHAASASAAHDFEGTTRVEKVEFKRLDELQLADVKFLKIDVEGFELNVVRGSQQTIKKYSPVMLIEIEQRHHSNQIDNVYLEILNLGYDCFVFDGKAFTAVPSIDDFLNFSTIGFYNFWFVPNSYSIPSILLQPSRDE